MSAGLRLCLPDVVGRGAGLGNELVPWSRAFLAAQVLGARCLPPAFGLNARGYGRHFGTPRWDWLLHRALKAGLPRVDFTEADYLAHGGGDVVQALRRFADAQGLARRRAWVLVTRGMWGGLHHIAAARDFVRATLYRSRYAPANLLRLRERLDPTRPVVGVHVRMGDFAAPLPPGEYRGRFNVSLPLDWYRRVMDSVREQLAGRVQFLLLSDARPEQLAALRPGPDCVFTADLPHADCSDLLALAASDLIVCSISSFSVWAAFLSDAPYLWYGPNLHRHPEGFLSIWGHEPGQQAADSPTQQALRACAAGAPGGRAWAVGHDGQVPAGALAQLAERRRSAAADLVRYGVVPDRGEGRP